MAGASHTHAHAPVLSLASPIHSFVHSSYPPGLSLKTLELYAFVFFFRLSSILRYQGYLPYDRTGDWLYSFLEISALAMCCVVIFLVMVKFNASYEQRYDTFGWLHVPTELGALYILVPCILMGMVRFKPPTTHWIVAGAMMVE